MSAPVGPAGVHPHLPRFAQAITGVICLESLLFGTPAAAAVALALILADLVVPRRSPVAWLFGLVARPSDRPVAAASVRFAQAPAAVALALGLGLLAAGLTTAGWALVGLVGVVALLSAVTGVCVGCRLGGAARGG